MKEKLVLTKYMSREHSLFYACVWNKANKELFDKQVKGTNVKNILFLRNKNGILEVYYDLAELKRLFENVAKAINSNGQMIDNIIKSFYGYWEKIFPYVKGKKIRDLAELTEYYENWSNWWAPMADIFIIPDIAEIGKSSRDKALKVRIETQEYSDEGDRVIIKFIEENYPKYKDVANLLSMEEIFGIDKLKEKDIENIRKRKNGCAILTLDGKSKLFSLDELNKELIKKGIRLDKPKAEDIKEIKGTVASKGRVKGNVRIVLTKADLKNVKKGEIMVTYATSPDYVPAMKLCAAIITNEGGRVCHAAIVARELNIPCIVGTKIGTEVLKDGMEVEVDATKGIIKIIKS